MIEGKEHDMGKKKQNDVPGNDAGPSEDSAMEPVEAPDVMEADGPVLEEEMELVEPVGEPVAKSESSSESGDADMMPDTADLAYQMVQLERETHELKETLLRKMAEFENLKKRTAREKEEAVRYGTAEVLTRLLEVLDNFDRALLLEPDSEGFDVHSFYEGMKLIAKHLLDSIKGEGLMEINPKGEPFDPFFHEAMMREASAEFPDNTVVEVFQKGYKLKDRLLRPARVKVALHPEKVTEPEELVDQEGDAPEENES
jgi:molecular chaperone GrpE